MQRKIRRQIKRRLQQKAAKALWSTVAAAGLMLGACGYTLANPTGGTVTNGTATIGGEGTAAVTVTQTTAKATLNWNDFSIGSGETVTFIQPGTSSIALNRVTGSNASEIYGALSSNGKVYLINSNGILFSSTAQVNVGGIVASTLDISDSDFISGNYTFSGNSAATVSNAGIIAATDGGYVVLLGKQVGNSGTITAGSGTVALGAGSRITLDFDGDGLLGLTVDSSVLGALAQNSGTISADSGAVYLSAAAADTLAGTVVNNSGVIRAQSIGEVDGKIVLSGGTNGTVTNSGTLDASGTDSGETGGLVKVLGETVELATGGRIDASGASGGGTVTLSATDDITVAGNIINTGGSGTIKLRADSDADSSGTVVFDDSKLVTTDGLVEIYYNPTGTTTTTINKVDTVVKDYTKPTDYSGNVNLSGAGTLTSYLLVNNIQDLQAVNLNLAGAYALGADIDAGGTATWNPDENGGYAGFVPLGVPSNATAFTGIFDGDGHVIRNLVINASSTYYVGLFKNSQGIIRNVGLEGGSITGYFGVGSLVGWNYGAIINSYNNATVNGVSSDVGGLVGLNLVNELEHFEGRIVNSHNSGTVNGSSNDVGGLAGRSDGGTIVNSYNAGEVNGTGAVGGLVGNNFSGDIINSYNTGVVQGSNSIGGLAGSFASDDSGKIANCYNTGKVSGVEYVGGLVGSESTKGNITNSYNTGSVNGSDNVAGLAGINDGGITNSYNRGAVSISSASGSYAYIGGLVGYNANHGKIANCYNAGAISMTGVNVSLMAIGGLVGENYFGGSIINSYNTGTVSGPENVGGLVGFNHGSIANSYNTGVLNGSADQVAGLVAWNSWDGGTITQSYWDMETSGTSRGVGDDSSFDALGRTTAQMMTQSNYPQASGEWDFTSVWGIIDGVSYPYLKSFYADTPQVISGTVGSGGGGQAVQTILNGTALSSVTTGANGFYYMLFANGTIADNDAVLAYINNGSIKGNAVYIVDGVNTSITGLNITKDTVNVYGTTPGINLTSLLTTAKGSLANENLLYAVNATEIDITGNLNIDSAIGIDSNIMTSGTQTYDGAVMLNGDSALTGSAVTFENAVDGAHNLTVNGSISFNGNVGGTTALAGLIANGSTGIGGDITVSGAQTYNGAVTLNADSILTGSTVTFENAVDGAHNLTVNGSSSFIGNIGETTALAGLTVNGATGIGGDITVSGAQTYNGAVTLNADSILTGSTVTFGNTIDGAYILTVNGRSSFNGNIGGTTTLAGLTVNGATGIGGDITASGAQTYNGAVTLNADSILTGNTVIFENTVDGAHNLTVNGSSSFNGNVGGTVAPTGLTVNGTTSIRGNISTGGNQIYNGAVTLCNNSVLTGTRVTFESMVDGFDYGYPFGTYYTLTMNGNAVFNGDIGGSRWLAGLAVNGMATINGNIATNGDQLYNGEVTLTNNSTLRGGNIDFNAPVSWNGAYTLTLMANNNINLNASVTATNGGLNLWADYYGNGDGIVAGVVNAASFIDVGTFVLSGGTWCQINSVLPNFNADDFRIDGGTFIRVLSGDGSSGTPYRITDIYGLQGISGPKMLDKYIILANDIDAGVTVHWNPDGSGGYSGFMPIAVTYFNYIPFTGVFDGDGHVIRNLYINRPSTSYAALFRESQGTIRNVGLESGSITGFSGTAGLVGWNDGDIINSYNSAMVNGGSAYTGGLVGYNASGNITNSYNTGTVSGTDDVGGLVGMKSTGTIANSYNAGEVNGTAAVGGLVGNNFSGDITNSYNTGTVQGSNSIGGLTGAHAGYDSGAIANCYNTGKVSGVNYVGGLVGEACSKGDITNSYNTGSVNGSNDVAGLAGINDGGITNSYNTGAVSISSASGSYAYIGGLVGYNANHGKIASCYNAGTVSITGVDVSDMAIGGLVGENYFGGSIINSYNTGTVSGSENVGGLVGFNHGSIANSYNTGVLNSSTDKEVAGLVAWNGGTITQSYWDMETSGTSRGVLNDSSFDALGRTTAQMMLLSNYPQASGEWDFTSVWGIIDGVSYPYLKSFYANTPQVISGTVSSDVGGQTVQTVLNGTALSSVTTGANGFYYMIFTNGTIADNDALLAYVDNGGSSGNAVYGVSGVNASITGLDITADTVAVHSNTPSLVLTNLLTAAKGSFTDDDILYDSTNTWAVITGNLTVNGICGISGEITTSGSQTYTGAVTLNGDRTLTSGATVTFGSTVTGDAHTLTIAQDNSSGGNAVFNGAVTGISELQVDGASSIGGDVTTSGNQTYTGAVTLAGNSALTGATVTFENTLDGSYDLTITGDAVFKDSVGAVNALAELSVSKTVTVDGDVITSGNQTYTGAVTLTGDSALTGSIITLENTVDGTYDLAIAGDAVFKGSVGAKNALTGLSVSKTVTLDGDVITSGNQTYTGAVTLNGDRILTSGDTVTFGSTVTGDIHKLTMVQYNNIGGNAVFNGNLTGIAELKVNGTSSISDDITTSGNQTYTGAVTLAGNSALTGATVTFENTVDGSYDLAITGDAVFKDSVGAKNALAGLSVSKTAMLGGAVITSGNQTYTGAVTLNGNRTLSADGSITFDGIVTASGGVEICGAEGITINQALNAGGYAVSLTTKGGAIRQSAIGVITAASLTLDTEDSNNGTSGAVYLDSAANQITTLSGTTGDLSLQDSCDLILNDITVIGSLTVSAVSSALTANGTVNASGALLLKTADDITIGANGSVTSSGGDVTMATTGGNFINYNTGKDAVSASSGRWLIYSGNLSGDTRGNLDYDFSQYGAGYDENSAVLGTGNGFIYSDSLTLTAGLTGTVTKTYDGTTAARVTAAEVTVNSNLTNAQYNVNIADGSYYADQNVGAGISVTTGTVTVAGVTDSNYKSVYGYSYTPVNFTADVGVINKAILNVTANNAIWYFGRTEPTYDASYTGLAGDDTAAVLGTLNYTTTYDGAMGGKYAIKVSGPAATANYSVSYVDGVLTVTPVFDAKYVGALTSLGNPWDRMNTDWGEEGNILNLQIVGQGVNLDGVRPMDGLGNKGL